jgi:glycolate oxidase iron-sulfur subunit
MALNEATRQHIDTVLNNCIHCGMCLPVCPTYNLTFQEQSSPRGRIRLIRSLYDGSLDLSNEFIDEMYFCLDCQACQTACPAGVHYGELVEDARNHIGAHHRDGWQIWFFKKMFLRGILSSKFRTKLFGKLLRVYQHTGLRDAIQRSSILKIFSQRVHEKHSMLPRASDVLFAETVPEVLFPTSAKRGRVAFLSGCIMNVSFSDIHRDAVDVLRANGFEVVIPKQQVCCGSLHGHNGDIEEAKRLARLNIDVFDRYEFDALVVDSAGCGAFLKEYARLLHDDNEYSTRAEALSNKTKDITEFLVEVGFVQPKYSLDKRITYHEACHLVHTQKVSSQPRQILNAIPGATFLELPEATWCCGSAGIYNIVRYDDSMQMLERKMKNIASTDVDIVVTANPGCHLQIQYGINKFGLKMEVVHPVTLLKRAYESQNVIH